MTQTNLHTLTEFAAARVPGHDAVMLVLSGEDGSVQRFVLRNETLQTIAAELTQLTKEHSH